MARTERPLDGEDGPVLRFAEDLREKHFPDLDFERGGLSACAPASS